MSSLRSFSSLLTGVMLLASFHSRMFADEFPARPLPAEDRRPLDEFLGAGVVGEAVPSPALPDGLSGFISLRDGLSWRMKVTSGKSRGSVQRGSSGLLNRPGGSAFRLDTGDGRNVLFGQLDAKGNLECYASQDNQEGVISRFFPPQPIFLAGLAPGESRRVTSSVSVADLSRPDVQIHSGSLEIEFHYVGAYRLRVPAGVFDAVLYKTRLKGKVGPAAVDDTIYRFFAKNSGPVAVVETSDVSAFLVYQEKTRTGKVLAEPITDRPGAR